MAFTGDRELIWHRMGNQMMPGQSVEQWAQAAGLQWSAIRTPAYHQLPDGTFAPVEGWGYMTRDDTLAPLGYVSNESYKEVQPQEILAFVNRYVAVDDRFQIDSAGSLDGGKRIWVNASYNGDIEVGGSNHKAFLLASTSFNGKQATFGKGTMLRTVCENTLAANAGIGGAEFRMYHNAKFDPVRAGKELSAIAKSFDQFKQMGDAMALVEFANGEVSRFFKTLLDIPFEAKAEDVSTRKMNQFLALNDAYQTTVQEGTERGKAWTALNAVSRYVDHDRSSRNGDSPDSARFDSALFGSGAAMKAQAVGLLMPLIKDKIAA
jgi:phage/plasmid-like protein (TIGR03299 family)